MKATSPGQVIGIALKGFLGNSKTKQGVIEVFLNLHWQGKKTTKQVQPLSIVRVVNGSHDSIQHTTRYVQLSTVSGMPPAQDCKNAVDYGRMSVDPQSGTLWICVASGWEAK